MTTSALTEDVYFAINTLKILDDYLQGKLSHLEVRIFAIQNGKSICSNFENEEGESKKAEQILVGLFSDIIEMDLQEPRLVVMPKGTTELIVKKPRKVEKMIKQNKIAVIDLTKPEWNYYKEKTKQNKEE